MSLKNTYVEGTMDLLNQIAYITTTISNFIWPIFLPILAITSLFISIAVRKKLSKSTSKDKKMKAREMIGPASISLGAKIGTGAIIGVLGSLNKLSESGQGFIEGIVLWGLLGAMIMIPLTYSETLIARLKNQTPVITIEKMISKKAGKIYSIALAILYIFGFGGFQFNGIDTVMSISVQRALGYEMLEIHRYLMIVLPIIVIASGIIITKKHTLFINAMSSMIGLAVISYFIFFLIFLIRTSGYIGIFVNQVWMGFRNPVTMGIGIPTGLILGLQRIIQTSEAGLGTSPLASEEGKEMGPHNSAITQVIPTAITVVVSLLITSYIASYGINKEVITFPADGLERLTGFFITAELVTGRLGLIVLSCFAILSGITTLLGSFFFLRQLFKQMNENYQIIMYIGLIFIAGTLAVFGFDIVFDVVDILLFVVSGLNVLALTLFIKRYRDDAVDTNNQIKKEIEIEQ